MCRGFHQNDGDRLKINAFYVHLKVSSSSSSSSTEDSLTLHYLPRINGSALEINGSRIRPDSPAFVTLHRVVSANKIAKRGVAVYGSRERVRASEGLRFEIYMGNDVKLLKGTFRRDERRQSWRVDCTRGLRGDDDVGVREAEVCVSVEGQVELVGEKVEMLMTRKGREKKGRCDFNKLEDIPEEREVENDEISSYFCSCDECENGVDQLEMDGVDGAMMEMEMEMDGVRWAVDVGIWVVCLGVGYLVTRASSKTRRRPRFI